MFLCSMQCAKHEVDNVFVAGFIIQLCTDMAADIGHFNPFYAIMHQLGSHVNIVYSEPAIYSSPPHASSCPKAYPVPIRQQPYKYLPCS